jgi:hypothetical protein
VQQAELLQELSNNLKASAEAYQAYLAGGKTFRYAQQLKKYNSQITSLILDHSHLLTSTLQDDAAALLVHYKAWTEKWEKLAADINPQPDDIFVFGNDVTFPRQAARNIEAAAMEQKGDG